MNKDMDWTTGAIMITLFSFHLIYAIDLAIISSSLYRISYTIGYCK